MLNKIKEILVPNKFNRDNWIKEKLSKIQENKKILDIGCGTQPYRKYCNHLKYFGKYTGEGEAGLQVNEWEYGKLD